MKKIIIFIILILCLSLAGCVNKIGVTIPAQDDSQKDLKNGKDTDKDGLSDYDEINVYKTNLNNPDSDGDGYLDGEEAKNGYSPTEVISQNNKSFLEEDSNPSLCILSLLR